MVVAASRVRLLQRRYGFDTVHILRRTVVHIALIGRLLVVCIWAAIAPRPMTKRGDSRRFAAVRTVAIRQCIRTTLGQHRCAGCGIDARGAFTSTCA
jgi:hypothetical protein